MVVMPAATPVARPLDPAALLMVALVGSDESHVTSWVMSCVVASEYEPIAVYCRVSPGLIPPVFGVTEMDISVADVTVIVVDPENPPREAVMVTPVPAETPVANPSVPALLLMD